MKTTATLPGTTRALFPPLPDSSTRTAAAEPEPKDQAISNEAKPDPKNLVKTGPNYYEHLEELFIIIIISVLQGVSWELI